MIPFTQPTRLRSLGASALLAMAAAAVSPGQAGEILIPNAAFDEAAVGWSWENWSQAGSAATHDPARNAAGGGASSGSLRLVSAFGPSSEWQQAVYTLDLPDFDASKVHSLSFDLRLDPTSTPRIEGDYGNFQFILRNGGNWDWKEQSWVTLNAGSGWQRFTVKLADGQQPISDIRALTIRVAQSGLQGPVIVNVDNIAFTEEVTIDNFDDGNIDGWSVTWGTTPDLTFGEDRYGRETSGSLRVAATYFDPNVTTWQQAVITVPFPEPADTATLYTKINVDVRVDPSSLLNRDNNYGLFEIKTPSGALIGATGVNLTGNEWTHLSFDITPSIGTLNGILIQLGSGSFTGPVTYNLDNLSWTRRFEAPPPPTLKVQRAKAGLSLVHTSSDRYGRHNIFSADPSPLAFYGVDSLKSVSYSFTLTSFPAAETAAGFQVHLFLVPGSPGNETSPDWNQPTLLFLDVKAGAGGTGNAVLRWKYNQANGNSQLYAAGLPAVNSATVLGTWTLVATTTGEFTVIAPDGTSSAPLTLPAEAIAAFAGPIRLYIGAQGNEPANVGQRAGLGGARVTQRSIFDDLTVVLEDNFTGNELDTSKWVANSSAGGVSILPAADAGWLLTWGLPDDGFVLQWTGSLSDPNPLWSDSTATPVAVGALTRQAHVPLSELVTAPARAFFRLIRR